MRPYLFWESQLFGSLVSVRVIKWLVLFLLVVGCVWLSWHGGGRRAAGQKPAAGANAAAAAAVPGVAAGGVMPLTDPRWVSVSEAKTNRLAWRLSNTPRPLEDLLDDGRAILLENALIDSSRPVGFTFPRNLQTAGDPGACIVQSRGPVDAAFRSLLARAGAQIVAYIPNNAYLARLTPAAAALLKGSPLVQSVLPYEPYYKIQMPLLGAAVRQEAARAGTLLNLGLFADNAARTLEQIAAQPGVRVVAREQSPFGPVARVELAAGADWTALAALPGVQIVEPFHRRVERQ